jgi:UDP-N-acetylmuramoyl-L-alanyl-D-glutamate--2,6-diaminopimelate ligase
MLLGDLATADLTLPEGAGTIDIAGLSADSRAVDRGYLFAALPGSATDGARFAADAVGRGAVAILAGRSATLEVNRGIPIVRADDPRRALALMAARFHPRQPEKLVAVTGTSGKTSVAAFARQIFEAAGKSAASVGTIGIVSRAGSEYGNLTTPDPVALHATLDRLARSGVTHAAIEASSHGLDQRRLDGIRIVAAAFTNLGRDHMDYHATVADYFGAKLRLFTAILPKDGTAIVDMDDAYSEEVAMTAAERGERLIRTGRKGRDIRLIEIVPDGFRQRLRLEVFGKSREVLLPLAGAFQASNALVAAGLAIGAGIDEETALAALDRLSGAPGRIELVGRKANGAMIFVDYAHKPDALESVLSALRPMTEGRLVVVIGAGGDRDPGKRPLMGEVAERLADTVIITDDNPRSEDPAAIRKAIKAAAPGAIEIGDRASAIREAIAMLDAGDVLCVAGKGHETGQIVGAKRLEFSDHAVIRGLLAAGVAA